MNVLDLFSGIGGFSLAAHWLGWETVAFVEKEAFCHKVLNKNFPGIPIFDDIFTFSGEPFCGRVDVVTGGFPCQPFSAAGKRRGRADERHLFPEMLRVIREVKPRWVVAENVRGLLSIEFGAVFAEVVASLEGEGYEVITFCIPASAVEAPHRRDRLWIVANRRGSFDADDARNADKSERREITRDAGKEFQIPSVARRLEYGPVVSRGADRDASNAADKRCLGRSEQGEDRGRSIQAGRGNGGSLGKPTVRCGDVTDTAFVEFNRPRRTRNGRDKSTDGGSYARSSAQKRQSEAFSKGRIPNPQTALNMIPTPATRDYKGASQRKGRDCLDSKIETGATKGEVGQSTGLKLQPGFVEWMVGLPAQLHITGSRDNRVARLKALGNSIVPTIAFEIFRAIEEAEATAK